MKRGANGFPVRGSRRFRSVPVLVPGPETSRQPIASATLTAAALSVLSVLFVLGCMALASALGGVWS